MRRVEKYRIQKIIFNRQQWHPGEGWTPYTGASPHTDHLHTEVGQSAASFHNATPKCAGGTAGYSSDSPELTAFLEYLGGTHYLDPFPRLRTEAGALTAFNLGSGYCRHVMDANGNPTAFWSAHAYRTAIDIGVRSITDGEKVKAWLFAEDDEMTLNEIAQGLGFKDAQNMTTRLEFLKGEQDFANGRALVTEWPEQRKLGWHHAEKAAAVPPPQP